MTPTLRLATLNTWKGDGPYWKRLEVMARGLAAIGADIICLQECFSAPAVGADTAAYLSGQLGLRAVTAPARLKVRSFAGRAVLSTSGLAILTQGEVARIAVLALPSDPQDEDRIALRIETTLKGHTIRIVNVHFTHLRGPGSAALRRRQASAAVAFAWDRAERTTVLAGDFNAPLTDLDLDPLSRAGMLDAGPEPLDQLPSSLVRIGKGETPEAALRAGSDQRAIDHIVLVGGHGRILKRTLALTDSVGADRVHASDHAAVVVDIALHAAATSESGVVRHGV